MRIPSASRGPAHTHSRLATLGAELFSFNGSKPFAMASVYTLAIAFEALAQISEQRLGFDQLVVIRPSDIRDCCALSRRHPQGGITLTLRELLELMIIESDNTHDLCTPRRAGSQHPVVQHQVDPGPWRQNGQSLQEFDWVERTRSTPNRIGDAAGTTS